MVLCEKEVALGGILKSEIALPFKREMFALTETYERFARNAGVEIRFNTEVTPEYVEKEAPDALIIAAGSRPLVPPIKGMDGEQVANGERHLVEGTTVICALGQRARTDVVEQLRNTAPFVRVIGDARRVSTITNAVYQGYHAALDI